MTINFYIGFFGWMVIIVTTVWLNWYRITKRKLKPHYLSATYSRIFFGAICLFLMVPSLDPLTLRSWIPALPTVIYIVSSFYLLFDIGLNAARKKRWDYQGEHSGWLDSMKKAIYHTMKAVCFVALLWSIIMIWENER